MFVGCIVTLLPFSFLTLFMLFFEEVYHCYSLFNKPVFFNDPSMMSVYIYPNQSLGS